MDVCRVFPMMLLGCMLAIVELWCLQTLPLSGWCLLNNSERPWLHTRSALLKMGITGHPFKRMKVKMKVTLALSLSLPARALEWRLGPGYSAGIFSLIKNFVYSLGLHPVRRPRVLRATVLYIYCFKCNFPTPSHPPKPSSLTRTHTHTQTHTHKHSHM